MIKDVLYLQTLHVFLFCFCFLFQYHTKVIQNIREAIHITKSPSPVAIAVEIAGQGIRTGTFLPVSCISSRITAFHCAWKSSVGQQYSATFTIASTEITCPPPPQTVVRKQCPMLLLKRTALVAFYLANGKFYCLAPTLL